ncbi:T9SS type A sorting domain-containing protein [Hymenobacter oligotrophus]|uniref:T9SS type A sorting domain-containing protein n=1 Tax=Hymenobacter oligotrophus TaxID=2319843 RepID=UPI0013C31A90|nr:T9SS type A sorting domain-containing protein [Hymenobacter oligotrophus]
MSSAGSFQVSNVNQLVNGNYSFAVTTVDATGGRSISSIGINLFETEAVYAVAPTPSFSTAYANGQSLATVSDTDGTIANAAANSPLPSGVALNATTGQFTVSDRNLLVAGSYPVTVTTNDNTGGITQQVVTIVIRNNPVLPVTLVSFTAQAVGQDVKLAWVTAQESKNSHFVVERSFDGKTYQAVGQVKGQGTKTTATTYAFVDAKAAAKAASSVAYYRLRQVDTDGTEAFSGVQIVTLPFATATIAVYPNPATSSQDAQLDLTAAAAGSYQVMITDLAGHVVRAYQLQSGNKHALGLTSLPSGTYLVQVKGNSSALTTRVVKQ